LLLQALRSLLSSQPQGAPTYNGDCSIREGSIISKTGNVNDGK